MSQHSQGKKPGLIRRFFGGIGAAITWLRVTLVNLIFLGLIVLFITSINPKQNLPFSGPTTLRLAPSGFLVDQRNYVDPITQVLEQSRPEKLETVVRDLVHVINEGAEDPRITGMVMELDYLIGGGISKLEEIGQALNRFKASGKSIIAISDNYSQDQYYLASYADEIYLNPMGTVMLTGYGSYRNYYKEALDKLAIDFHVFRVGDYKDFIEPYTRNDMSESSKENNKRWIQELWSVYSSRIEKHRSLPRDAINNYINNLDTQLRALGGDSAQLALQSGLVDKIIGSSELSQTLRQRYGAGDNGTDYKAIDYWDYLGHLALEDSQQNQRVGLIVAKGNIVGGEQPAGAIGSETLVELLKQAEEDKRVKALVLRIDSGGGSAFASETIRQAVNALREKGKPVVISMGSVTASGGYWIAAAGDEIWATPTTITGSIGVFGAFPTAEKAFNKLGIYTDGIGTTKLAGAIRLDRDLPPIAENVLQQGVEFVYRKFINLVADARQQSPEAVHQIAQGQVWSGGQALENGLVDKLGYLEDAVASAASMANLDDYSLKLIQIPLSPREQFLQQLSGGAAALRPDTLINSVAPAALRQTIAPLLKPFVVASQMNDPRGVYAQCESCLSP